MKTTKAHRAAMMDLAERTLNHPLCSEREHDLAVGIQRLVADLDARDAAGAGVEREPDIVSTCFRCEGTGRYKRLGFPEKDCALCNGTGKIGPDGEPASSPTEEIERLARIAFEASRSCPEDTWGTATETIKEKYERAATAVVKARDKRIGEIKQLCEAYTDTLLSRRILEVLEKPCPTS